MTRSRDGWHFGDVTVNPATFELLRAGAPVHIEPKALEVLVYLIERRERVVTKQELIDDLWQGTAVTENALTRAIAQIRKVLNDDLQSPRFIQTVPTRGYRFVAELKTVEEPGPKRRAWPLAVAGAAFLILAIGVLIAMARQSFDGPFVKGKPPAAASIAARPLRPSQQLQSFPSFSPDGRIAYSVDVEGTPHIFTAPVGGGSEVQITNGDGETQPAWSPDGDSIAYVSARRGGIWMIGATGGEPAQLTEKGSRPAWSPDGDEIAFQSAQTIEYGWTAFEALPPSAISIVNVRTRATSNLTIPGEPVGGHGAPSWRADGRRLAFSSCDLERCAIYTIGRDSSTLTLFVDDRRRLASPLYSPDGQTLYYVLGRYNNAALLAASIGEGNQRSGPIRRLRESNPGVIQHLALSRDGRRFAWSVVEEASDLFAIGLKDPTPQQLTASPTLRTTFPAFSPDGTKIAYCAVAAGEDSGVWVMDADGRNAKAVSVGSGLKQHTSWTPSGWEVVHTAWTDGPGVFKTSLVTGESARIGDLPRNASAAVLSPDGSTLAFNRTVDGAVSIWTDSVSGSGLRNLTRQEHARFPVWARSGKTLAVQVRNAAGSSIGTLPIAGGPIKILTTAPGESHPYTFSPDERSVVFAGRRNGVWNLYTIDIDGGAERPLTTNKSLTRWLRSPAWSPTGDRIVYESGAPKGNIWVSQQ